MSAHRSEPLRVTMSTGSAVAVAYVSLRGDVDPAAAGELRALAEHLRNTAPSTVLVDLAGVTFACSTLANFLVQVRRALPEQASLALIDPTDIARLILAATGLTCVTILDQSPNPFEDPFGYAG